MQDRPSAHPLAWLLAAAWEGPPITAPGGHSAKEGSAIGAGGHQRGGTDSTVSGPIMMGPPIEAGPLPLLLGVGDQGSKEVTTISDLTASVSETGRIFNNGIWWMQSQHLAGVAMTAAGHKGGGPPGHGDVRDDHAIGETRGSSTWSSGLTGRHDSRSSLSLAEAPGLPACGPLVLFSIATVGGQGRNPSEGPGSQILSDLGSRLYSDLQAQMQAALMWLRPPPSLHRTVRDAQAEHRQILPWRQKGRMETMPLASATMAPLAGAARSPQLGQHQEEREGRGGRGVSESLSAAKKAKLGRWVSRINPLRSPFPLPSCVTSVFLTIH